MIKYINNIGQNTGTSNTGKKVMEKETSKLFADLTQNLNSGSFRTNGLQQKDFYDDDDDNEKRTGQRKRVILRAQISTQKREAEKKGKFHVNKND